jgi:hypothetical protein
MMRAGSLGRGAVFMDPRRARAFRDAPCLPCLTTPPMPCSLRGMKTPALFMGFAGSAHGRPAAPRAA